MDDESFQVMTLSYLLNIPMICFFFVVLPDSIFVGNDACLV